MSSKNVVEPLLVNPSFYIKEGLRVGYQITLNGIVLHSGGTRFAVNLQNGLSDQNIAFHFNPRFEEGGYVVCNTKKEGSWGTEERNMHMPFQRGNRFELCLVVQNEEFQVRVDGKLFLEYTHRVLPLRNVDTISVTGGLGVYNFNIQLVPSNLHPSSALLCGSKATSQSPTQEEEKCRNPASPPHNAIPGFRRGSGVTKICNIISEVVFFLGVAWGAYLLYCFLEFQDPVSVSLRKNNPPTSEL